MRWYDLNDVDTLYARVWGDSIHFGIYDQPDATIETAARRTKDHMADLLSLNRDSTVLEVGCGYGSTARHLARTRGCTVVATNYSPLQLVQARSETPPNLPIRYGIADYHALPFGDAVFDAHWSQESLVHSAHKDRYFAEAFRILKPGGHVIFSDQTTNWALCTAQERDGIAERHHSSDLYALDDFVSTMQQAGFETVTAEDQSRNMTRHFENLVKRIEDTRDALADTIDPEVIAYNEGKWRWAAELAHAGKIGWGIFVGRKPLE